MNDSLFPIQATAAAISFPSPEKVWASLPCLRR